MVINRDILRIPLGVAWPALLVDEKTGACLAKLPKAEQPDGYAEAVATAKKVYGPEWEKRAGDFSLLLGRALARANEIFIEARLDEVRSGTWSLGTDEFLREYRTTGSRADFLVFMETQIEEQFRRGSIKKNTWKNHRSTLNSLREFRKKIPFNSLTYRFADEYEAWLKRKGKGDINTRWGRHKDAKTCLAEALKARITFENPYKHFKVPTGESSWKPMTLAELATTEAYYQVCAPGTPHRRIL